jgi:hypothetical protein
MASRSDLRIAFAQAARSVLTLAPRVFKRQLGAFIRARFFRAVLARVLSDAGKTLPADSPRRRMAKVVQVSLVDLTAVSASSYHLAIVSTRRFVGLIEIKWTNAEAFETSRNKWSFGIISSRLNS